MGCPRAGSQPARAQLREVPEAPQPPGASLPPFQHVGGRGRPPGASGHHRVGGLGGGGPRISSSHHHSAPPGSAPARGRPSAGRLQGVGRSAGHSLEVAQEPGHPAERSVTVEAFLVVGVPRAPACAWLSPEVRRGRGWGIAGSPAVPPRAPRPQATLDRTVLAAWAPFSPWALKAECAGRKGTARSIFPRDPRARHPGGGQRCRAPTPWLPLSLASRVASPLSPHRGRPLGLVPCGILHSAENTPWGSQCSGCISGPWTPGCGAAGSQDRHVRLLGRPPDPCQAGVAVRPPPAAPASGRPRASRRGVPVTPFTASLWLQSTAPPATAGPAPCCHLADAVFCLLPVPLGSSLPIDWPFFPALHPDPRRVSSTAPRPCRSPLRLERIAMNRRS